jgi:transcriptional regulator with XRE-family HTH domain
MAVAGSYPNRVREFRLAQQPNPMTQAELARRVGIRASHLCAIEKGRWIPRDVTQEKIARALGVPREELFGE